MSSEARAAEPRRRSRSPAERAHSSREPRRHRSRSRSRSRSRGRDGSSRHRHRRSRSRSHSRSRERHRHSSRRSRSPRRHTDRHTDAAVKREQPDSDEHRSAHRTLKDETTGAVKSEPTSSFADAAARSGAAAHAARPVAAVPSGLKVENEPSEAAVIAALNAAAAAAAPRPTTQSATAPSAAPAVVPVSQQTVNYAPSGLLAAAANTVDGVERKYVEPVEARVPDQEWRLYVFKEGQQQGDPLRIHRQSLYMIGRDEKACDLPVAHPSCSKQHAVIQFRQRDIIEPDGITVRHVIKPYLMDLGSTNGTFLMGVRREPHRYYEMLDHDLIRFGCSTREYVLINASSGGGVKK